jgi:hypothetical protein
MQPVVLAQDKDARAQVGLFATLCLIPAGAVVWQSPVIGTCIVVLLVFLACVPFMKTSAPSLTLTEEGVSFGNWSVPWREVTGIRIDGPELQLMSTKWNKKIYVDCRINDRRRSYPVFPWMFGKTAEDLAGLMVSYYADARRNRQNLA